MVPYAGLDDIRWDLDKWSWKGAFLRGWNLLNLCWCLVGQKVHSSGVFRKKSSHWKPNFSLLGFSVFERMQPLEFMVFTCNTLETGEKWTCWAKGNKRLVYCISFRLLFFRKIQPLKTKFSGSWCFGFQKNPATWPDKQLKNSLSSRLSGSYPFGPRFDPWLVHFLHAEVVLSPGVRSYIGQIYIFFDPATLSVIFFDPATLSITKRARNKKERKIEDLISWLPFYLLTLQLEKILSNNTSYSCLWVWLL